MVGHHVGLAVAAALASASVAAADVKNIDRTLPLSATGTVAVEAHNGWIQVRTWDRPEVEVHVRIEWPFVSSSSYRFRATTVDVDGSADRVSIRWNPPYSDGWTLWSLLGSAWTYPEVRYTITAPRTARVEIRSHNANTDVRDVDGAVRVSTHNGHVQLGNLAGSLDLSMHNGWARVEFASFTHDSRIGMHNGIAELALPASSKFVLDSRGHHMHVDSDFPVATQASHYRNGSVSGSINGGGPDLRVVSHNGSLRLRAK